MSAVVLLVELKIAEGEWDAFTARVRRHRALVAIPAFANPAGNADRLEILDIRKIETVRIDDFARVTDLAAKRDGEAADRCPERRPMCGNFPGKAEISNSVRRFGELPEELSRCLEGAVHVPQRAGAAITRKLKRSCGMALRDRAGLINSDKEEWHALGSWSLQGRQPMSHLFE